MDTMRITSPAFQDNAEIPAKHTCDGENVNPELVIENVPAPQIAGAAYGGPRCSRRLMGALGGKERRFCCC